MSPKELETYVAGLVESGVADGFAYAEIVTPALVAELLKDQAAKVALNAEMRALLKEYRAAMRRARNEALDAAIAEIDAAFAKDLDMTPQDVLRAMKKP